MSKLQRDTGDNEMLDNLKRRLKRWLILVSVSLLGLLIAFFITWHVFFKYVPPGHMLVVVAKFGTDRDPTRTMSQPGEKGALQEVLGEGWHFITPIVYATEVKPNVEVPPGKVGIVMALGGKTPRDGHIITDHDEEKGIRRKVLSPGTYRFNPYGYQVDLVPAVEITPGHVGVQRRLLGKDSKSRFAASSEEKGILREVLQPGLYFINTQEYELKEHEVGIYQTSYHHDNNKSKSTGLSFPVKDGYTIALECTIEWEVLPRDVPELASRYTSWPEIEKNVIDQQARKICQDRGFNYGAQDFLEGNKREKFQEDFSDGLKTACQKQLVKVNSAYIRNIIIPENFLKLKRDRRLAEETRVTNEAKQELAQSNADVEEEKKKVKQAEEKVGKETEKLVAEIKVQVDNLDRKTTSEIEQLTAKYSAQMAELDAQTKLTLAEGETHATRLKETARSSIFKMKLDVFQGDGSAYMRYTLAEQLNPKLSLRLFHAGPGTFWTNLDGKSMNLMLTPTSQGENKESTSKK